MPMNEKQQALLQVLGVAGKLYRQQKTRFKNFQARRQAILDAIDRIHDESLGVHVRDKVKSADAKDKKGDFESAYTLLEKAESNTRAKDNGSADLFTVKDVKTESTRI